MWTPLGLRMCVRNMEASVFQMLPVEFPVGVATRTRLFTTWPRFWSCGLLSVGEKAPKALLVTSAVWWNAKWLNLAVMGKLQLTVRIIEWRLSGAVGTVRFNPRRAMTSGVRSGTWCTAGYVATVLMAAGRKLLLQVRCRWQIYPV